MASALLVSAVPGNGMVFKDVSTFAVDFDWTEVEPGTELKVQGTFHHTVLLFTTDDPQVLKLVFFLSFRGTFGIRSLDPNTGILTQLVAEEKVDQVRYVGTVTVNATGVLYALDGLESQRLISSLTLDAGALHLTGSISLHVLLKVVDGRLVWTKFWVVFGR